MREDKETTLSYLSRFLNSSDEKTGEAMKDEKFLIDSSENLELYGLLSEVANRINQGDSNINTSPHEVEQLVRKVTGKYFEDKKDNGEVLFWLKKKYRESANTLSRISPDAKSCIWFEEKLRALSEVSSWQEHAFQLGKDVVETEIKVAKYTLPATCIITGAALMVAEPSQLGKVVGPALIELGFSLSKPMQNAVGKERVNKIISSLQTLINTPPPEGI